MIYKLEREEEAWRIIRLLHGMHAKMTWLVSRLRNNVDVITTTELLQIRDNHQSDFSLLNDFYTSHETWFDSAWSDYATALSDTISTITTINTIINDGIETYYWDADTDKPIISEITEAHRNSLANSIEAELEV